jgi:hypothetical protein
MKSITRTQFVEMMLGAKGTTFSGLTYHCDESKSRTKGGRKMLQKIVDTTATLNSVYKAKIDRILAKNGIAISWTPNPITGREFIEGENRCIVVSKKSGELQLAFVQEKHTKTKSQLLLNGQPVERADVWNENYIQPAKLVSSDKDAVKNSMFNHAIKAVSTAENEGNAELAEQYRNDANALANCADLQGLEFYYRTLGIDNILTARFGGEEYLLTGKAPKSSDLQ